MDWQTIVTKLRLIQEQFDKSYKCLNTNKAPTKDQTVEKHLSVLFERFEQVRVLINVNYSRLTHSHQVAAEGFFLDIRSKLATVLSRRGLDVKIPDNIHEELKREIEGQVVNSSDSTQDNTDKISENLTPLAKMAQTVTQFLGLASKLLPDFDGKPENLQSFLDALALVESMMETHEQVAVNLIKTKLKGTSRNLLSNETTIASIIATLKSSVKGDSVEVITAKLLNVRQGGKNANAYAAEIDSLTKSLESAYISDGLHSSLATKYSTQTAVRAIAKNATNERVKLIMESGNFLNMNEVMAKFVNSCTESFGQPNSVLYYGSNRRGNVQNRGNSHNRGNNRGNGYGQNNNRRGYNNNRGNNYRGNGNNNHGRGRGNYRNSYRNNTNQNIRLVAENNSGNGQAPLNMQ